MRLVFALSAIAVVVAPFGCASILGDFSSGSSPHSEGGDNDVEPSSSTDAASDSSPGAPDGSLDALGTDSTMGDAATRDAVAPTDAQGEGEAIAPLQPLSCTGSKNPLLISQLYPSDSSGGGGGNNQGPFDRIYLEHIPGMNAARIVVATNTPNSNVTVYTVPESGSSTVSSVSLPGVGLQAELKTSSAVTFLAQDYMNSEYAYYSIADTDPGNLDASLANPQAFIGALPNQPMGGGGGGHFQLSFAEFGPNNYYTLANYSVTGGQYDLAYWLTGGQPVWQLILGPGQELGIGSPLIVSGTAIYGFFPPLGSANNGPSALFQYTFSPSSAIRPSSRSVIPSTSTAATVAATGAPNGASYSLAFVEIAGAQTVNLRAGMVSAANINTFMVDDLPPLAFDVQSDAGFFDTTPFGGNNGIGARWLSDGNLALLGSGGAGGSGGNYTGLNFYVATPNGQWVVEAAGSGKNVLPGQTVVASAFDLASGVSDRVLQFDVTWVQTLADGSYALYFAGLTCD